MSTRLYAMHEPDLAKYLEDQEAAITLLIEKPELSAKWGDDEDDPDGDIDDIFDRDAEGTAHISVGGVLTMNGPSPIEKFLGMNGTSYKSIIGAVAKANADPATRQVALEINSPGGSTSGMNEAWRAIRESTKPVTAVNRGMMASAAYGLASAAGPGRIFAADAASLQGSVGIQYQHRDTSKRMEAMGIKEQSFVSRNAPLKNADPGTEVGAQAIQDMIDAMERNFHAMIAEGRGISAEYVSQNFGRGAVLVAQDPDSSKPSAIKAGMIDKIMPAGVPPLTMAQFKTWALERDKTLTAKTVTQPAPAGNRKPEENRMDLKELLEQNPEAKATYLADLAKATSDGENIYKARAEKIGKILASEAYKSNTVVQAKGFEAISGKISAESFDQLVAMADMLAENAALVAETNAAHAKKETPGEDHKVTDEVTAKAKALKIDIEAVKTGVDRHNNDTNTPPHMKMKFEDVLAAEIHNAEITAADKARLGLK